MGAKTEEENVQSLLARTVALYHERLLQRMKAIIVVTTTTTLLRALRIVVGAMLPLTKLVVAVSNSALPHVSPHNQTSILPQYCTTTAVNGVYHPLDLDLDLVARIHLLISVVYTRDHDPVLVLGPDSVGRLEMTVMLINQMRNEYGWKSKCVRVGRVDSKESSRKVMMGAVGNQEGGAITMAATKMLMVVVAALVGMMEVTTQVEL